MQFPTLLLCQSRSKYIAPAVSYVAPAPVDGFSGPVTFSAPVENVAPAPAAASTPVQSGESRGTTDVPHRDFPSS